MIYYIIMNVKSLPLITAVVVFIFFFIGAGAFRARAVEHEALKCPEQDDLAARKADIGGFARNLYTGWITNRSPESDDYKVQKKGREEGVASGGEIFGKSKVVSRPEFGYLCWGETCAEGGTGSFNDAVLGYPRDGDLLDPPSGSYAARGQPFAELDFEKAERMCKIEVDGKAVVKSCAELDAEQLLAKEGVADYCAYPLKGWARIVGGVPGKESWTRLSTRIYSTAVPVPKRNADGTIVDPGTFGRWEGWGDKIDCSNDDVYLTNKKSCTRGVVYDPRKKEFYGWAWNPVLKWISFSGSTLYDTREWANPYWCAGVACTSIHYNQESGRSRWSTRYLGVWVHGIGGNLFSREGFGGVNPPPGQFNSDYLVVTGRYTEEEGQKKKSPWEGRCDDRSKGSAAGCFDVRRSNDEEPQGEGQLGRIGIFANVALPTASQRDNRSAIKRSVLGSMNTAAFLPKEGALPKERKQNDSGQWVKSIANECDVLGVDVLGVCASSIHSAIYLNNTIYYHDGDLVIGAPDDRSKRIILNGTNSSDGGGTVVVRGNLIIKRPIEYNTVESISSMKKLASLSWVVLEREEPLDGMPERPEGISDTAWNELIQEDDDPNGDGKRMWNKGGNIVIDKCLPANDSLSALGQPDHVYDRTFRGILPNENPDEDPFKAEETDYINIPDARFVNEVFRGQKFASIAGSFFAENIFVTGRGAGGAGPKECANLNITYRTSVEKTVVDENDNPVLDGDGNEQTTIVHDPVGSPRTFYYDVPLEIRGIVVARNIIFERAYRGVNRGSETIINTGRLLVNPPPGIAEFVRSLPLW